MHEKPMGVALVLCDQISTEAIYGRSSISGATTLIYAPSFPHRQRRLGAYVLLTNGRGRVPVTLRCQDNQTGAILGQIGGHADFPDPMHVVELKIALRDITFPSAGSYAFDLLCGGELVLESHLDVVLQPVKFPAIQTHSSP